MKKKLKRLLCAVLYFVWALAMIPIMIYGIFHWIFTGTDIVSSVTNYVFDKIEKI